MDGISFSIDTSEFDTMTAEIPGLTDRATKYALRATGRYLARIAESKAPVYKGSDPRASAESGNLRKSISNARNLISDGTSYELKVGPWGTTKKGTAVVRHGSAGKFSSVKAGTSTKGQVRGVPLYRQKMEKKYGFMAAGNAAADSDAAKEFFESAYTQAWSRWVSK